MLEKFEQTIIWTMLIALVLPAICFLFTERVQKLELKAPPKANGLAVLGIHRSILYLGISIFIFFLGVMLYSILIEQSVAYNWLFIFPISLGTIITLQALMVQVSFNNETVQYKNTLGQVTEYKVNDLEFKKFNRAFGWHEYEDSDGKKIRFPVILVGMQDLVRVLGHSSR